MEKKKHSQLNAKQKLLASACEIFSEKGFRDATVKDICELAGTNIATVNYYFGSKKKLYAEAWRKSFHESLKKHPPDGGVPEDAPAEERLRGRIKSFIHRIVDKNNQAILIMHKEMAKSTPLLIEVSRECLEPIHREMRKIISELLGKKAGKKEINFCEASIISQCFGIIGMLRGEQFHKNTSAPSPAQYILKNMDEYIDHIIRFSLAGIRATRKRLL